MQEITTTEAIEQFLKSVPVNFATDLTSRCTGEMECQIMVDPSEGDPVYDGDKLIRNTWQVCSEDMGTYNYHHIRIPRNAMSDPYFNDTPIRFPIQRHIECIGMTGWNWKKRKSMWVAFDFDAITGHAQGVGVSDEALESVKAAASKIPWVQIRKSTSGSGLHIYVFFDPQDAPDTENHTVHSALARAVLGLMERESGFDFRGNMDVLGGNMWVWHRKVKDDNKGLSIIKDYEHFCTNLPENWRDNLDVVTGQRGKIKFNGVTEEDYNSFETQSASRIKVELDKTHKEIEERIHELGYSIIWVPDHHCWQTHSRAFQDLMEAYPDQYKGVYKTLSEGKNKEHPNCFAYPLEGGGFRITRFGRGAREHETWSQEKGDWTWIYFNKEPTLLQAAMTNNGFEDPDGKGWVFTELSDVAQVCRVLGNDLNLDPDWLSEYGNESRNITLRSNKQNQLVVEMERKKEDERPYGWIEKGKSKYTKLVRNTQTEPETSSEELNYDDKVRALVDTHNKFSEWVICNDNGEWIGQNKDNTRSALKIWAGADTEEVLGKLVIKNWKMVNVPFQPEYIGNRLWNRNAPQFTVSPAESNSPHRHWDMILDHCGQDLDDIILKDKWCKDAGISTGADYLTHWVAFMLRDPYCKLPYLFFYGPQNSGKSIFHEAVSTLVTRGVMLADESLKSKGNFNGELAGAVLCVVEETDLSSSNTSAYAKMKSWVTGEEILIHHKFQEPYQLRNTSHWCQMANEVSYCPIFPGDTRIVMMHVPMLEGAEIPKDTLMEHLRTEAPAFLRTVLDLTLPPPPGRLKLPVLETESKTLAQDAISNPLTNFIKENCYHIDGSIMTLSDFFAAFSDWLSGEDQYVWTYNRTVQEFRNREILPFGKQRNNVNCLGNISLEPPEIVGTFDYKWIRHKQKLVKISTLTEE